MKFSINSSVRESGIIPLLFGLLVSLYFFTFQIIDLHFLYFPGDLGDGRLNLYFLEHAHKFFMGQIHSFWNAPFMYPEPRVITYSDNLLGSAPIYSLFRFFGFDTYTSYQSWYVSITILNYLAAFLLLKKVFKNNYAAVLGAIVFAFSIALQSQLTHSQMFPRFAIPLSFLMIIKFMESYRPQYFFFALLFVVYQFYCGIYLGFLLIVPFASFLTLVIIQNYNNILKYLSDKRWLLKMALSAGINLLFLLLLMLPYSTRKIPPCLEHYKQISSTIPTVKSHFFSQQGSLFWDFLSKTGIHYSACWDHQIFAGGIATICLIFAFILLFKAIIQNRPKLTHISLPLILMFSAFLTFIFYLRIDKISPYLFIYYVPGFSSMRSLTRIINIELLFFAIASAFVFSIIFQKLKHSSTVLFLIFLAVLVSDNYMKGTMTYRTDKQSAIERVSKLDSLLSHIPPNSVISYEPVNKEGSSVFYNVDAMLVAQKYNLRTINGYTANCPGEYGRFWNEINEESRNYWLSGENLDFDLLYVVKSDHVIEKIHFDSIGKTNINLKESTKIHNLILYIKTDKNWMEQIKKKALLNHISIDSMVTLDAIWVVEHKKK